MNHKRQLVFCSLSCGFALALSGQLSAQTLTTLREFTGGEGALPSGSLALSGNTLYGTASGGSLSNGTVFAMKIDGSGFTNLHDFAGGNEGTQPQGPLVVSDGTTLYGATQTTLFRLNTDGTGFTTLHSFVEGAGVPNGGLVLGNNTLY